MTAWRWDSHTLYLTVERAAFSESSFVEATQLFILCLRHNEPKEAVTFAEGIG